MTTREREVKDIAGIIERLADDTRHKPLSKPKEPCPCCGSDQLIIHDDGMRRGDSWSVICRDCGCKGFEHCNKPLAILCWDSGARQMRETFADAQTIGWEGPIPSAKFDPMTLPEAALRARCHIGEG